MSKSLVVFFSASGVTAQLAEKLSKVVRGDLHEIYPKQPYTLNDLDWMNKASRSSVEMNDKSYRPAIANKVENMDKYDVIYIGFPIWWYIAPTIINTFLEQYDLDGKKIIPFATSGSSGMGNTNKELKDSCGNAILLDGKRFGTNTSEADIERWIDSLQINYRKEEK